MTVKISHCNTICLLLTVLALAITTFLLVYTLKNEITDNDHQKPPSTTMTISPVKPEDLPYPPMKLCYSHWSAWVNFTAAYELNFTKPEVLYAMSYLTQDIYSVERFHVEEASESFFRKLKDKELTMTQFFLKTARKFDPMIFGKDSSVQIEHTTTVEPVQLSVPLFNQYYVLCYTLSDETIADMVTSRRNELESGKDFYVSEAEKHIGITINPSEFETAYGQNEMHNAEQDRYLEHLSGIIYNLKTLPGNERFPALVYINAYKPVPLVANVLTSMHATVKASGYVKKNQTSAQCQKGKPHFIDDRSCYDQCEWKFDLDHYHCNDSRYDYYPRDGARFHFMANDSTTFEKPQRHPRCYPESQSIYDLYVKKDFQCMKQCQQMTGCITWAYDVTVERSPFSGPVTIQYPIPEHTMVMEEIEPAWALATIPCYTVSLLGLWFCMFVVAMIQIVDICACCGRKKSGSMEVLVKE